MRADEFRSNDVNEKCTHILSKRPRNAPLWQSGLLKPSKAFKYTQAITFNYKSLSSVHQCKSVDAPALHSVCMTEIKAVYSAQHKHIGIDIVMSTAGFWLSHQQEHLSCPGAQITKSPVDQCVLPSNECAVNMINVIRLTVYPPVYLLVFPALSIF